MKHYTKEELEQYRHGQMSVLGRISCSSHLHECDECQKLLDELVAEDEFVKGLRSSIQLFDAISKKSTNQP